MEMEIELEECSPRFLVGVEVRDAGVDDEQFVCWRRPLMEEALTASGFRTTNDEERKRRWTSTRLSRRR